MEQEQEYTGTIVNIIHPYKEGIIQYRGDNLICFKTDYFTFFRKRGTWQIGDKVFFSIRKDENGNSYADIAGFIDNPNFEKFMYLARQNDYMVLKGYLKVFDGEVFFLEQQSKLIFLVQHITALDIKTEEGIEYEAILNVNKSQRFVILSEWMKLWEQIKALKRNRETINTTVIDARYEYLKVPIPGTHFYGKVYRFDRAKEFKKGDTIELYPSIDVNYRYHFGDVNFHKTDGLSKHTPIRDKLFSAIINGSEENYYQIEIIGEYFTGVVPKTCLSHRYTYTIGDVIDVYYCKRTIDSRYMFFTTQQFERIQERTERKRQNKRLKKLTNMPVELVE